MWERVRAWVRRPPLVVSAAAAAVGVVDIVSALTPELAGRVDVVEALLPPGGPELAGAATFASGVLLLVLSRSLARAKHRAWLLAVALVAVSAAGHLAKGLDVEEAAASGAVLVALVRWRRFFDAPGDPASFLPALGALALLCGLVALWFAVVPETAYAGLPVAGRGLALVVCADAAWLLYLWLRPWREPPAQTPAEHARARDIVARYGDDSLSFFALRRDRRYAFSSGGEALIAYRVVAGCALVSGDPIGRRDEIPGLVADFARDSRARGWRLVVLHATEEWLPLLRARGMKAVPIGDEAVLDLDSWGLEGRAIRKVRQAVARCERAGYRVAVLAPGELDGLRDQLADVSAEWLGRWKDRGFSMAMDDLFAHPEARFVVGYAGDGRVGGFLHLVPSRRGYSLSTMRRRSETPNGLMESLIAAAAGWARDAGAHELSLNFSVFADVLRADAADSLALRAARWTVLRLDRLFQLERLFSFNRKFLPRWRTRYVCFERAVDVPLLSIATLHVEELLRPPSLLPPRG